MNNSNNINETTTKKRYKTEKQHHIENKAEVFFLWLFILIIIAFIIWLLVFKNDNKAYNQTFGSYTKTATAMDTVITLTLYESKDCPLSEDELSNICDELLSEVYRLESILSANGSKSELSALNNAPVNTAFAVSDELFEVLSIALEYCLLSDGHFDISVGNLISLWNITGDNPTVPDKDDILPLAGLENYKNIVLDSSNKTVTRLDDNAVINLGAIAKGYIGDKIKELATKKGIKHAMLNLGGNVIVINDKSDGTNWTIGITNPSQTDSAIATVSVDDMCVVTSGNYERYFVADGVRYHHILNPFTGYPADNGIISSTIIGKSSTICDALSTACYVYGTEKALKLVNGLSGYAAVFIDDAGNIYTTDNIEEFNFTLINR